MRISSLDIRRQKFGRAMRGYDPQEVDAFIELIADSFEQTGSENLELRERLASLRGQLERYQSQEERTRDVLMLAKQAREDIEAKAEGRAELIIQNAQLKGRRILEDARKGMHQLEAEMVDMENRKEMAIAQFRALVQTQVEFLSRISPEESDRTPAGSSPEAEPVAWDQATGGGNGTHGPTAVDLQPGPVYETDESGCDTDAAGDSEEELAWLVDPGEPDAHDDCGDAESEEEEEEDEDDGDPTFWVNESPEDAEMDDEDVDADCVTSVERDPESDGSPKGEL